jgi:histidinol-phosphate/aromatic aminotransferase/cobyric acid decarboxylase-like protein
LAAPSERAAVWDEAFFPLATGAWTRGDPGAMVVGSLTKLWSCPGLRLGYVLAPDPAHVEALRARQPQWAVNGLALAVVPDLVAATDLGAWRAAVADLRADLVAVLGAHGLVAGASAANFVLVPSAPGVREHLAGHGIAVRDTASFGLDGGVRIAVPDEAGLARLTLALEDAPW